MLGQKIYTRDSAAATVTGNSGSLNVTPADAIAIDIDASVVSGTTPSLTPSWERLGADGIWYPVWTGTALTAAGKSSQTIGKAWESNKFPGHAGRLVWTISGTTPSFTFSASVVGIYED